MPESGLRRALLAAALAAATAGAADLPGRPNGPVLDLTGTLNRTQAAELDGVCREIEASGKGVLVVAIVPTLDGDSIESYAVRLFKAWGIGSREKNNGVLLLISTGDRKVRIETGYGVEAILPDGRCGEIIRREILPKFKAGDPGGGVIAGARAITAVLDRGEAGPVPAPFDQGHALLAAACLLFGPAIGIFMLRRITQLGGGAMMASFAALIAPWIPSFGVRFGMFATGWLLAWLFASGGSIFSGFPPGSRTRRGGWTGGGGWGSSGGGFGGGGSGGSFGGFGGGFSGGGGASGSW